MSLFKMRSRYLLWFAQEHIDFRFAEIESITSMFNIPLTFVEEPSSINPYWIVDLPDEESARKIASRSVSLKNCIELWSRAKTAEQLHNNLKTSLEHKTNSWTIPENTSSDVTDTHICPYSLIEACRPGSKSFKIDVETFCKHFTMKEKVDKIENFHYLPMEGPVKLKNPDITLSYIEFYGTDPNNVPELPHDLFFGRLIADGQRELLALHSLKTRRFIGNTSMDAALALLTANQARVGRGSLVLDPFVGSGSLLVAAAHFGAYVWGTDIDYMMLHARSRPTRVGQKVRGSDESIAGNMRSYGSGARYLDALVADSSRPPWRRGLRLDAILTDPPYGVREPNERIGIEKDNYTLSQQHLPNHIPAKVDYELTQLYADLLEFAAQHLAPGGRLVCWYPLVREDFDESHLPSHPRLSLVASSQQALSRLTARRLLTYEKGAGQEEGGEGGKMAATGGGHNFREKYFLVGEVSRKERRERRAAEVAHTLAYKNTHGNVT